MYIVGLGRGTRLQIRPTSFAPSARRIFRCCLQHGLPYQAKSMPENAMTKTGYCRHHLSYKEKKRTGAVVPRTGCRRSAGRRNNAS